MWHTIVDAECAVVVGLVVAVAGIVVDLLVFIGKGQEEGCDANDV